VGQVVDRLGAQQGIGRIQDLKVERAAEAIGQQPNLFFWQQFGDGVLDVGGFLFVRCHH